LFYDIVQISNKKESALISRQFDMNGILNTFMNRASIGVAVKARIAKGFLSVFLSNMSQGYQLFLWFVQFSQYYLQWLMSAIRSDFDVIIG